MALAHHDAPERNEWSGRQGVLLRTERRRDADVSRGFELTVRLESNSISQIIKYKGLLRFRDAELPGQARTFNTRPGRRSRAAVAAGHDDVVGLGLRDARGDDAHTYF